MTWWDLASLCVHFIIGFFLGITIGVVVVGFLRTKVIEGEEDPSETPEDLFKPFEGGDR